MRKPESSSARLEGFDRVVLASGWCIEDDTLILTVLTESTKVGAIHLRAVHPQIWRVTFFPPGVPSIPKDPIVARRAITALSLQVEKTEDGLRAFGADLVLEISFRPWKIRFVDSSGKEVFSESHGDVDGLGRPQVPGLGTVENQAKVVQTVTSFRLNPGECLFGLGEKFTRLDKNGQRLVSWNQDALGSTSERSHKNIPFLWTNRGYGLFVDSSARITWELGSVSCQSATVIVSDPVLDYYLLYGPAPAKILELYTSLTGRAPLPPKWSFGLWISSGGKYRTQPDIGRLLHGLDEHEFPADVLHIDTWWMRERKYCDFQWNKETFPRPGALIDAIHRRRLKLSLWEHPYISIESELFPFAKERGYFVRRPDGEVYVINYGLSLAPPPNGRVRMAGETDSWNARVAIIDLTNPEAAAWFKELHRPLFRMGVDVFKTDFGEDIPEDAVFFNGQTGETMHNLYPLLYNRLVFEVTQEEKGFGVVWARSAFAGSQQYPLVWSGDPAADFQSLACTIRGGLSAGMSGLPFWSNDIGGYRGTPAAELYVRWAQFGLFCSHSRMHGDSPREPWHFGKDVLNIVRRFAQLRYELFPYIYSASYEASLRGMPVLRALPLIYPGDPNVYDKDYQYLFGPWFLVAPVVEADGLKDVYLPAGTWFDYWTGKAHRGPRTLRLKVPLDILPLYVRGGAIIPKMQAAWRIPEERIDPLLVEVWPEGTSSYPFYEDEGLTEFKCRRGRKELDLEWTGPLPRRQIFHFMAIPAPRKVRLMTEQEPDKTLELCGLALGRKYVLAVPEAARGKLKLIF